MEMDYKLYKLDCYANLRKHMLSVGVYGFTLQYIDLVLAVFSQNRN